MSKQDKQRIDDLASELNEMGNKIRSLILPNKDTGERPVFKSWEELKKLHVLFDRQHELEQELDKVCKEIMNKYKDTK